jgi:hypothetical protein
MKKEEILNFIESNDEDDIKNYFYKLIEKLEGIKKENNKIQIWLIVLVFIHFGIEFNFFKELNVGPVNLQTDNHFIKLFIPLVFTFMLLQFATLNAQRAVIINNIREIGTRLFSLDTNEAEKSMYSNKFLRTIMPFSLSEEVNEKFLQNGKVGIITVILTLPLFLLLFTPFIYEYIAIKDHIVNFWGINWFENLLIIMNIWLLIVVFAYYIKLFIIAFKEAK